MFLFAVHITEIGWDTILHIVVIVYLGITYYHCCCTAFIYSTIFYDTHKIFMIQLLVCCLHYVINNLFLHCCMILLYPFITSHLVNQIILSKTLIGITKGFAAFLCYNLYDDTLVKDSILAICRCLTWLTSNWMIWNMKSYDLINL